MILGAEIGLFVYGIIILIKGRTKHGKEHEVRGGKARIIGVLCLCPVPMAFIVGFAYGYYHAVTNQPPIRPDDIQMIGFFIELGTVLFVVVVATILSGLWKQPIAIEAPVAPMFGNNEMETFVPPTDSNNPFNPPSNQ